MALSAKVSTKHQIALPSEARRRLGIQPGDRLTVLVREDELVLRLRPARASARLRGLAAGAYGPDPDSHLRDLRTELEATHHAAGQVDDRRARRTPSRGRDRR